MVSKFDPGLIDLYKPMYFDRNISEKGSYLSCVRNSEFHFSTTVIQPKVVNSKYVIIPYYQ